jgi:hypothetical protein
MGWGYEINVMTTPFRKLQHHLCDLFSFRIRPFILMAYIEILTKTAEQVAGTDKNSTGAMTTDQRGFFAKMSNVTGNPGFATCFAKTFLPF